MKYHFKLLIHFILNMIINSHISKIDASEVVKTLKLIVGAVRGHRPVGDLLARLPVRVQGQSVSTSATVSFRNRKTQILTFGIEARVSNQVRLLRFVKHFEWKQLRIFFFDQKRFVVNQVELHDVAFLELGPQKQILVKAEAVGPVDDAGIGLAAQMNHPIGTRFQVGALNRLQVGIAPEKSSPVRIDGQSVGPNDVVVDEGAPIRTVEPGRLDDSFFLIRRIERGFFAG